MDTVRAGGAVLLLLTLTLPLQPALRAQQGGATPARAGQSAAQPAAATSQPLQKPLPPTQDLNTKEVKTKDEHDTSAVFPAAVPVGRAVIGLALEGGGALGLAHVGVLAWLDAHRIPVDRIAGTSMGCLVGSLEASGHTVAEMSSIAAGGHFQSVFALRTPYGDLSFRRKQDRREMSQAFTLGLKNGVGFRNALLTDEGLNSFLLENYNGYERQDLSFDSLPTPLRCVATDLNTLKPVIFDGGTIPEAVRASISIPGIFSPFPYRGHFLADGAIVDNLPSGVVRNELKADVVIAVHLEDASFEEGDVSSILGVFARAYQAGTAQTEKRGIDAADHVIRVDTKKFSTTDYTKSRELFAAGYQAAEDNRAALEKYALSESDWEAFQHARASRRRPAPGLLKVIEVAGGSKGAESAVGRDLKPLQGQTISPSGVMERLKPVQSDGTYSAVFETFNPAQPGDANSAQGDTGVRVLLSEDPQGPPYLLFGPAVAAMSGNVAQTTFDFRVIDQNFGGYGSELRTSAELGYLTRLDTEYYRQLTPQGVFAQPELRLIRRPVYIWNNQKRTAEYFEQNAGGGLSFGQTISPRLQASAQLQADVVRWDLETGQPDSLNYSGTAQRALFHISYDGFQSGVVSPRGYRFEASSGALYHSPGSPVSPFLDLQLTRSTVWREKNVFGVRASSDTYFGRNVADPFRFTLGGPFRLSASSIDEYRGTDDYLVSAAYLRQVLPLPSGIGQGIYGSFGYEAGEIWAPERPAVLRQDIFGAFVAVTPLGAVTVGGAVGDAGRRKVFVTLGRTY